MLCWAPHAADGQDSGARSQVRCLSLRLVFRLVWAQSVKVSDLAAPRRKSRKERQAELEAEKLEVEKAAALAKTVKCSLKDSLEASLKDSLEASLKDSLEAGLEARKRPRR